MSKETFEEYIDCNCYGVGEDLYNESYGDIPASNSCITRDVITGGPWCPVTDEHLEDLLTDARHNCIWMKIHDAKKCHLLKRGCYYCTYLEEKASE